MTVHHLPVLSRAARAALGWSQKEASEKTGIPRITLARFETMYSSLSLEQGYALFKIYAQHGCNVWPGEQGFNMWLSPELLDSTSERLSDPENRRSDCKRQR